MLENQRRLEKGIPGCPNTKQTHVREFFEKLAQDVMGDKYLPTWSGELYLEYHRGTYTTMGRNKKGNSCLLYTSYTEFHSPQTPEESGITRKSSSRQVFLRIGSLRPGRIFWMPAQL